MRALRWHRPDHAEIADDTAQPRIAAPRDDVREPPMSLASERRTDPTAGEAVKVVLTP
ncbi:hypothetical protein SNS2_4531 [Streptomyces netropsis]|uniref:Uncharacterized protein n=1 Tax=Streptomyces syringium TaxID=76729 RepID=A0ABS4YE23_9ACTN|nr:hypothetical protein [Streptomyces syringium]MBP2407049.1 hypothetical protein [Streptomyces syringium]SPE62208.1 hypothetical protein SNS2_4531 [Streptomyces netropsis]